MFDVDLFTDQLLVNDDDINLLIMFDRITRYYLSYQFCRSYKSPTNRQDNELDTKSDDKLDITFDDEIR